MDLGPVACSLQHWQQGALVYAASNIDSMHNLQVFPYHLAALSVMPKVEAYNQECNI